MKNHVGARAQRESRQLKAKRPAGAADRYDPAVERYLRLQSAHGDGHEEVLAHNPLTTTSERPHGQRAGGPLHHEHVVINGRNVEVTEDAVGVVELHLMS